jgi:predicted transglutaminase-like cysteine proteinase
MYKSLAKLVAAATVAFTALPGASKAFAAEEATYAAVGEATSIPYGWIDFCRRYHGECDSGSDTALDVNLTAKAMKTIREVNAWVNRNVEPISDEDHWGLVDRWDFPADGRGDCEDFALLKRRMLIEQGFPRQALLMTVVKDENNEGHAILTVKTNHGEFVLDNLIDEVKPWNATPYRFVKRQSQENQNVWVAIGPPVEASVTASR